MRSWVIATVVGGLLTVGPTGCFEKFDDNVMFQNNNGQDLLVMPRDNEDTRRFSIPAHARTPLALIPENMCTSAWLIYDNIGKIVVKYPGKICWHQTVTIP
jgi:hypothetical protein